MYGEPSQGERMQSWELTSSIETCGREERLNTDLGRMFLVT